MSTPLETRSDRNLAGDLAGLELLDPQGEAHAIEAILGGRLTVMAFIRHFG